MEGKINNFDIVSVTHKGERVQGVVLGKDVEFEGDLAVPTSELFLGADKERVIFRDSDLSVEGKFHTPFTWRDIVHVKPSADDRSRFYARVSGISWEPNTNAWWFAVTPMQGGETEMFAEAELTAVGIYDFVK